MSCRYVAPDQPRVVVGRHDQDCPGDECAGCQPCTYAHCRVCSVAHAEGTCPECVGATRDDLHAIARMCGALTTEVEHRGVNGEAMVLLGPAADWEARGHLEASVAAGRVPADWLEDARDENHPAFVLNGWDAIWRDALEHDDTDEPGLATFVDYLDRNLSYMADFAHVPFEDFSRDLRRCRGHLEAVLHDGDQLERSRVPCLDCAALLVRRYGHHVADDHHLCPRCKRRYDSGEFARAKADWLGQEGASRFVLLADATQAVERPEFTIRTWIRRGTVSAVCDIRTHRLMVWWPDVRDQHRERKVREMSRNGDGSGYALNNPSGIRHA